VCLNTNALEFDYSNPVPDFGFLSADLRDESKEYFQTVGVMHVRPTGEQFNNNVKEFFQQTLLEYPNLRFCLHAHSHKLEVEDIFNDGIMYYGCSAMKDRNYLLFTLTQEGYDYEVVWY